MCVTLCMQWCALAGPARLRVFPYECLGVPRASVSNIAGKHNMLSLRHASIFLGDGCKMLWRCTPRPPGVETHA